VNLLRSRPWRCGRGAKGVSLPTSDNPIWARWARTVSPWSAEGLPIHRFDYYVPLSPVVMLKLDGPRYGPNAHDPNAPEPIGTRTRQDFSLWETSFARHLVTSSATGYLYGLGPIINARSTDSCLRAIQQNPSPSTTSFWASTRAIPPITGSRYSTTSFQMTTS